MAKAKAKAKIGDKIVIKRLTADPNCGTVDPRATEYVGKTGIVESINELGDIAGTWGSLSLLPTDEYEVLAEGESVHIYEIEGCEPIAYILPRELYDLLQHVYETGQANVDCIVNGHILPFSLTEVMRLVHLREHYNSK